MFTHIGFMCRHLYEHEYRHTDLCKENKNTPLDAHAYTKKSARTCVPIRLPTCV